MQYMNKEKYKEVLHYIINSVGGRANVGKTVIYKLLYFTDFDYYELHEEMLTGETYRKILHGPAPWNFDEILTELQQENKVHSFQAQFHGHLQAKYSSLVEPSLEKLSGEELKHINNILDTYSSMNASNISEWSHNDTPWKVSEEEEDIDYELVFYREPPYAKREYEEEMNS